MLNYEAKKKLFGYNLAMYRDLKGYSQEKLAEIVECSRDHIAKVETAKRNMSIDLFLKVSSALNVPEYKFFIFNN